MTKPCYYSQIFKKTLPKLSSWTILLDIGIMLNFKCISQWLYLLLLKRFTFIGLNIKPSSSNFQLLGFMNVSFTTDPKVNFSVGLSPLIFYHPLNMYGWLHISRDCINLVLREVQGLDVSILPRFLQWTCNV